MTPREFIHEYRLVLLLVFFGSIGAYLGWATGEGLTTFILCMPMAVLCYLVLRILEIIEIRFGKKNGHFKRPH
jgi:hypothetical protein